MTDQKSSIKAGLQSMGFSEKEADVYVALLELGKGSVSAIAHRAHINRTTGYDILATLVNRGLVRISGKKPKQEYVAESPDKLHLLLQDQWEKDKQHLAAAEEIIPQLKSIHVVSNRPTVKFYEGTAGLIEVYEDTLTAHEPIIACANVDYMHNALPDYFPEYYSRRAALGIVAKGILPKTPLAVERVTHNKEERRESALVPVDKYNFSPEVNIYDNKVMIASWREKLGIIIESQEIADAMKKIFELAWIEAKRLEKADSEKIT